MDNPRADKVAVVDEVRQHFDESDAAILTEYRGLKVKELAELRRSLAPSGGEYRIYKNTLVRFAAQGAGLVGLDGMLTGPTAIAFVKGDAAAVAKSLRDYSRTQPLLVIKGGVLGDKVISSDEAAALADLPSREVLLARFAGALAAPMQQMAGLLQALPRNLAYGLAALRDQRVAAGEDTGSAPEADAAATAPAEAVAAEPTAAEPAAVVEPEAPGPAEESPAADAGIPEAALADDGVAEGPTETSAPDQGAAAVVADSPAAEAGTPEAALALDDAAAPALAAEAQDPAPTE